ncbi:MAG: hypothetical protein SGBAC_008182 [Bacillariaceae sp.]
MAIQRLHSSNLLHMQSVGSARLISDRRQLAGIMLLLGVCAAIEPLVDISLFVGKEGFKDGTPMVIASFTAALVQVVFGCLAAAVGFFHLVLDCRSPALSGALIAVVQGAWAPFVVRLYKLVEQTIRPYEIQTFSAVSGVGTPAKEEYVSNPFIADEYVPTVRDVRIVGSTGIVGELSYLFAFYGALAFCAFAIDAFDRSKPTARDGKFYRGRHLLYSFVLALAGLSQLLLGAYILFGFGSGPLQHAITVAMYTVYYPEMTIAMGTLQMVIGYFGIARHLDIVPAGADNHQFQAVILFQWISMLAVQYLTQISLSFEDDYPTGLPEMVLISVGLNVFPAFLDYKMRTTPFNIPPSYYGLHEDPKTFPSDMQGIASRGIILPHTSSVDEEMANQMPEPEEEPLIQTSSMDIFQDEPDIDDQNDVTGPSDPIFQDNSGRSQGSESIDPPTDPMAVDVSEEDESEQPFDSDSDTPIPSRRSSQMHPLASTGFFQDKIQQIEDSMFGESNPPTIEEDQDDATNDSDADVTDAVFREQARHRNSDATEMASNQMKELESLPIESSQNQEDVEYNPDRKQTRERSRSRDPPGVTKSKSYSSHDDNSDTPDDDTDALDEKLQEIERDLYTDSMEQFRQSLVHIL